MFKILADEYVNIFTVLNLFNYITIRTGAAILTSLFFSLIFGELIIKSLSNIQPSGQPIRNDGPKTHILNKIGTAYENMQTYINNLQQDISGINEFLDQLERDKKAKMGERPSTHLHNEMM